MVSKGRAENDSSRVTRSKIVKLKLPKSYQFKSPGEDVEEALPSGKPTTKIVTLSISSHLLAAIQKRNAPKAKATSAASSTINSSLEGSDVCQHNVRRPSSITVTDAGSPLRKSDDRSRANPFVVGLPLPPSEHQDDLQQAPSSLVYQRSPFSSMNSVSRQFEAVRTANNPFTSPIEQLPSQTYPSSAPSLVNEQMRAPQLNQQMRAAQFAQQIRTSAPHTPLNARLTLSSPSQHFGLHNYMNPASNTPVLASNYSRPPFGSPAVVHPQSSPRLAPPQFFTPLTAQQSLNSAGTIDTGGCHWNTSLQGHMQGNRMIRNVQPWFMLDPAAYVPGPVQPVPGAPRNLSVAGTSTVATSTVAASTNDEHDDHHFESTDDFKDKLMIWIQQMMFVSGETAEPSTETTGMIEEIVRAQVIEMVSN